MSTYVIFGAGPVGSTTARVLVAAGHRVVVATRRGSGPSHPQIQLAKVDATNEDAVAEIATGSAAIVNCINPPYTEWAKDWPPVTKAVLGAARRTGSGIVTMSNLYGYGPRHTVMRSDTPLDATGTKGRTRADMWRLALEAHRAGDVRVAEVRASDFFGPEVVDANMGERVIPRVLRGKGAQLLGKLDVDHSFSYMPDVATTLAAVVQDEESWGRAWLVPSITATQRSIVESFAQAAGRPMVKLSTVPSVVLRGLGLFVPMMRELAEVEYQFASPFVVDASDTTQRFAIAATDVARAAGETIAWWRSRPV